MSKTQSHANLRLLLTLVLAAFFVIFAAESWHWPWTNDSQVFHYAVFLIGKGMAPYRQIIDLNLPGSYLSEWIGMHLAPDTDLSYRIYDLLLLLGFTAAAAFIARPFNWFAGVFAGMLFSLIHGSEGAWMMGERDLVMAVLVTFSYALVFRSVRLRSPLCLGGAAAMLTLAATLKPFAFAYALVLLPMALWQLRSPKEQSRSRTGRALPAFLFSALSGGVIVGLAACSFLLWRNSLHAFLYRSISLAAYYSSLHRTPLGYMLHHSTPRALYFLLPPAVWLAFRNRSWRDWRILSLQIGVVLGLLSYFAQNKGFIYHRYPWVALALVWIGLEFTLAIHTVSAGPEQSGEHPSSLGLDSLATLQFVSVAGGRSMDRVFGLAGLLCGTLLIAPFYLSRVFTMPHNNAFALAIVDDMHRLSRMHPERPLDGHVQCLDGIAGCYSALFRLGLVQSTGVMGDQLFFQKTADPVVTQYRAEFWHDLIANPPQVFIETNYWYGGPQQFEKTATWPSFDNWLHQHYMVFSQRTFPQHPGDIDPIGYRIYLLHP